MAQRNKHAVALTIAGSDSGGGAGLQADLNTFASLGVHGTSVVTAITAQNPRGVSGIQACRPHLVRQQLEAVFAELPPRACKTGMLLSAGLIREVARFFRGRRGPALVVDPVMVATSGASLLERPALTALREELLPGAALVTPNVPEAERLLDMKIRSEEDLRQAARRVLERYGCPALLKGGHLEGGREAVDIFYDGRNELLLTAPRIRGLAPHGTGCTYSAAMAGYLALGCDLPYAAQMAKEYITQAIAQSRVVAGHRVLNWFWE